MSRRSGAAARADLNSRVLSSLNVAASTYFPKLSATLTTYCHELPGAKRAPASVMRGVDARFVDILRSESDPDRHYVAANVDNRLAWHNDGPCGHTQHRPWSPIVVIEFPDEPTAARFERYMKSGSGRAFAKRHFTV